MFFVQISDPAQSWAHSTLVLFAPCNPDPETLKKMPPPVPWTNAQGVASGGATQQKRNSTLSGVLWSGCWVVAEWR
jgi:hypothetical protein